MPQCAAVGCTNRSDGWKSNVPEDVSFHSFPLRNGKLLRQWLHNIGRKDFMPTKASKICSAHFLPHCFMEDAYAKYGMASQKKKRGRMLTDDAVPTEFAHRSLAQQQQQTRPSSLVQMEKRQKQRESAQSQLSLIHVPAHDMGTHHGRGDEPEYTQKSASSGSAALSIMSTSLQSKKRKKIETVTRATAGDEQQIEEPCVIFEPLPLVAEKQPTPLSSKKKKVETVTRGTAESDQQIEEHVFIEPTVELTNPAVSGIDVQSSVRIIPVQYGTPRRTKKDHAYSTRPFRTFGTQTEDLVETRSVTTEPEENVRVEEPMSSSPFHSSPLRSEGELAEYLPSSSDTGSSSDPERQLITDPCQMKKYIVFEDNLDELHKFCKKCGSPVVECSKFTRGSMVGYKISCHKGDSYIWHSQPFDRQQPVGNLLVSAAVITSGNTYAKINAFAELLNLQLFSKSVYNKIQKNSIIPVIQDYWAKERNKAIEETKSLGEIVLGGDGRCGSPGHTAKYGSYTLMSTDGDNKKGSRKIVSMQLVQVSEVKNSNHMEPEGLRRCLRQVKDDHLKVRVLATDRHLMVTSMMKKDYKEINHQFDTWHLAKSIVKKLTAKAKQKDCSDLSPWIQNISNHLWWSCATCKEDGQILREKWMSVLHHVSNKHEWSGNVLFHRCDHPKLSSADKKGIMWLKPESAAYKALKVVVTDTAILKALEHLTKFCHTGELEIFHSMLLKYCPKRQHFHYDGMYARLMLAAIEWNNSRREQAVDKSGKPATSVEYSKRRKAFVLKNRYAKVKSTHMNLVVKRIFDVHHQGIQLEGIRRPPEVEQRVATVEKPDKSDLERQFMSRFSK